MKVSKMVFFNPENKKGKLIRKFRSLFMFFPSRYTFPGQS